MPKRRDTINVGEPRAARLADGRFFVSVEVDGESLYVAADEPLAANGDAWTAALLLPAAKAAAALRVDADLDEGLHARLDRIQAIAHAYWRFPGASVTARRLVRRDPGGGRAMFFSGGLDSFYTLHQRGDEIDKLICVHGFDVAVEDAPRFALVQSWASAVAAAVGVRAVFAKTNLRRIKVFNSAPWEATHGGALAAIAHALAPQLSSIVIAGSDTPAPWGSRPGLDCLWTSNAVKVLPDGSPRKIEKVKAIAHWPLVHRYLRVCYESTDGALNCGRCRKCVRTQVLFHLFGAREKLETFPQAPLVDLIDALPPVSQGSLDLWTEMIERAEDPAIRAAIGRFVHRRPTVLERVAARTTWLRRFAAGRHLRRAGKRLLARR